MLFWLLLGCPTPPNDYNSVKTVEIEGETLSTTDGQPTKKPAAEAQPANPYPDAYIPSAVCNNPIMALTFDDDCYSQVH